MQYQKKSFQNAKLSKIVSIFARDNIKLTKAMLSPPAVDYGGIFNIICKQYKIATPQKYKNNVVKKIFREIVLLDNVDKETFKEISFRYISVHLYDKQEKFLVKATGRVIHPEHQVTIGGLPGKKFYNSPEWRGLRYLVLEKLGNSCQACGVTARKGKPVHVDHIKPRSYYPELALDINNLQILCEDCNIGKSNRFQKDWRVS